MAERRAAADALEEAERAAVPVPPLSDHLPGLDVDDAYAIQLINVDRRITAGRRVVGHKVGLTAKVMQEMLGVDEPDYGHLLDDMVVDDGGEVAAASLCAPRVEVEVAFVLRGPLEGPGCTAADVVAATERLVPTIEIIDSRIADWRITLCDTIADNASSARVVFGPGGAEPTGVDLTAIGAELLIDGVLTATGSSDAVLGNPANAVAWSANKLAEHGQRLEAGHVVIPGSCTKAFDVAAGNSVEARFAGLGSVTVEFS
jgi:2-keto-4-pentenoate hydratase